MGVLAIGPVEPPFLSSPKHWGAVVVGGALFVLGFFILAGLVRYWAQRMQKVSKATGEIDLANLQRQRDAGEISQEEYEPVRAQIVAAGVAKHRHGSRADATEAGDNSAEHPINHRGDREEMPEGRKPDGQG